MDLTSHPHFTPWTDPQSGLTSYLIKPGLIAPFQQPIYFVNSGCDPSEKVFWLECAWPPGPQKSMTCLSLDPTDPWVRHFPQAQPNTAHPMVDGQGNLLFGCETEILSISPQGEINSLFTLPAKWLDGRKTDRLATHLTLSADGKKLLLDGSFGKSWFVGTADLGTGEFQLIRTFDTHHNHAQFHPHDPNRFLIARDQFRCPDTGKFTHHTQRTFLMTTDGDISPCINPQFPCSPFHGACHEWWTDKGKVAFIDYDSGVHCYDPSTSTTHHIWKEPLCHGHCSRDEIWWCADESPYKWQDKPCQVIAWHAPSGKRFEIQSSMEQPSGGYWKYRARYHLDPHPNFSPQDTWIIYTAFPDGIPTPAFFPVSRLECQIQS